MKYIFRSDIFYLKNSFKKITLIYLGILIGYIIYLKLMDLQPSIDNFYQGMGLNFDVSQFHPIVYMLFGIYFCYYLMLMIKLFFKDIMLDSCNLFLRIAKEKWYIFKMFSISIITLASRLIIYLLVILLMDITGLIGDNYVINILPMDILWLLLIQQLFIFLYLFFIKYKWAISFFLLIVLFVNSNFIVNILFISQYFIYYFLIFIVLVIINYTLYKKVYIQVIEKQQN